MTRKTEVGQTTATATRKPASGNVARPKIDAPAAAPIIPIPGQPNLNAHSGEVLGTPAVRAVYWGSLFGTAAGLTAVSQQLDAFLTTIFNANYFQMLGEYNVGPATFLGSTWIPNDPAVPLDISMSGMQINLKQWLDGGLLPEVPIRQEQSLMFAIFLSPEITAQVPGGRCSYHDWGHYHKGSGKHNLFWAVIPFPDFEGAFNFVTANATHMLVNTFTNRSNNRGWYDDNDYTTPILEVADVCSSCASRSVTIANIRVASFWRESVKDCLQ